MSERGFQALHAANDAHTKMEKANQLVQVFSNCAISADVLLSAAAEAEGVGVQVPAIVHSTAVSREVLGNFRLE